MRCPLIVLAALLLAACAAGGGKLSRQIDQGRMQEQLRSASHSLSYRNSCSFHDETGYKGSNRIEIEDNRVLSLATAIELPHDGGRCNFEGPGFRQTRSSPSIELLHPDGCTARLWTQGQQLTISYTHCEARCTQPQNFRKIWPVLIDMPSGRCD
ncbi:MULTISPECIES: hypothetical protein [unclassified Uliginosibacterium]|uniref:hypothetical protein n=1 Tax=unclassified Uliginosibacterium TaxID=2621521 RepID=UPI000C7CC2FB|nr:MULTISPECIES: hypothetical protein [unclassified Uliginosibacterium]MDO6386217.1 hypothetical protein [Uliginosibacterium sp. 31-12]PLK49283.1 hypothetical protein C0V76_08790 [Uliginosibacterium sp. TH139]